MEDSLSLFEDAVHYLDISGNLKIIKETAWKFKKLAMVRACLSVYSFTLLISLHLYDKVFACSRPYHIYIYRVPWYICHLI